MDWKHNDPEELLYWEYEPVGFPAWFWFINGMFAGAILTILFIYFFE